MIDFGEKMIPFVGYIEPTLRCNHTCFYCYREKAIPAEKDELTRDEIKVVLDDMASLGTMILVLTGGEIFLRPDIFDIIEDARKRAFAVVLFTNGSLTDEKAADKIKELAVTSVEITVRAADAAKHDEITGMVGSFEKTVRAIRLLRERGVHVKMKYQVHQENISGSLIQDVQQYAKSLAVKAVCDSAIIPARDGNMMGTSSALQGSELMSVLLSVSSIPKSFWDNPRSRLQDTTGQVCGAGMKTLTVSAQGEVYPCVPMRFACGSIRK